MAIASSAYNAIGAPDAPTAPPALASSETLAPGVGEKLVSAEGNTGKPLTRPELGVVLAMLIIFVICWLVAAYVIDRDNPSEDKWFKPAEGITAFAVFYVLAQAIERIVTPIARLVPTTPPSDAPAEAKTSVLGLALTTRSLASRQRASAVNDCAQTDTDVAAAAVQAQQAANWQEILQQSYVNATTVWAIGAGLAFLFCAWLDVYLLNAIGVTSWNPPLKLDLLLTGLAVGGGTVPLHGLIDRLQKKSDQQASNTATSPTPGGGRAGVVVTPTGR